jgi:hypothetical protein
MNNAALDIASLKKSAEYRVCRTFVDFYSNMFLEGTTLTFVEVHFLPYHGGYTVVFKEGRLYLHEQENANILNSLGDYLKPVSEE